MKTVQIIHREFRDVELALKTEQIKHGESRDIELALKTNRLNMENQEIKSWQCTLYRLIIEILEI